MLYINIESTVLDEAWTGVYRQLFHPDRIISGKKKMQHQIILKVILQLEKNLLTMFLIKYDVLLINTSHSKDFLSFKLLFLLNNLDTN
jgi:hypothetical protein